MKYLKTYNESNIYLGKPTDDEIKDVLLNISDKGAGVYIERPIAANLKQQISIILQNNSKLVFNNDTKDDLQFLINYMKKYGLELINLFSVNGGSIGSGDFNKLKKYDSLDQIEYGNLATIGLVFR